MNEGDGGQFHHNEAISAVADEGFLGEEDDDYEDLYNDVNVGEGFLQTLHRREEEVVGFSGEEEKKVQPLVESVGGGGGMGQGNVEKEVGGGLEGSSRVGVAPSGRVDGYNQNQGLEFRGSGVGPGPAPAPAQGQVGGGMRVELGQPSGRMGGFEGQGVSNSMPPQGVVQQQQQQKAQGVGGGNGEVYATPAAGGVENYNVNGSGAGGGGGVGGYGGAGGGSGYAGGGASGNGGGGTMLFVGDLHWWTTDAQLEMELRKYGEVKEVKFFDEKASGKSKGYCQVEFYDPAAATRCKEGMNGHEFNGRPCVVAFASPYTVRRMGEAQVNKNQAMSQSNPQQGRRVGDAGGRGAGGSIPSGGNYQGGEGNRSYGRGNWRGNGQGMGGRGGGPMRNRMGGMGGRGIMGNGGNGFGQGMVPNPQMMHPQSMIGQGFDPSYGAPMGRMAGYGGFPGGPTPPFSGMMQSFPPVGGVGMPGVAPHVNPAFFGRGMPANGMGVMPNGGMDGQMMGMWSDPSAGGWAGDEPAGRAGESSYGDDAASDHQYGDGNDRGPWPSSAKEKDRGSERDWSGAPPPERKYRDRDPGYDREMPREKDFSYDHHDAPERRHRDDREMDREMSRDRERDRERERDRGRDRDRDRDRDRYRDDRERPLDHHRYKEREPEYDDDWDKGRSSRTHSKPRPHEDDYQRRSRSRDAEYAKRRRLPSE